MEMACYDRVTISDDGVFHVAKPSGKKIFFFLSIALIQAHSQTMFLSEANFFLGRAKYVSSPPLPLFFPQNLKNIYDCRWSFHGLTQIF